VLFVARNGIRLQANVRPARPIPTSKRAQLAKTPRLLYILLTAKGNAKLAPLAR
jgi:hypothetical protein